MPSYFATQAAASLVQRGHRHLKKERYQKAFVAFGKAISRDPRNADAHAGLAAALHALGRDDMALEACETAIRCDHECYAAYRVRAAIHEAAGRADEAAADRETGQRLADAGAEGFQRTLRELTPKLLATPALIAINVAVFAVMVASGVSPVEPTIEQLIKWGAGFTPITVQGEWWRLLTSNFLHIGLLHLALNMWVLWDAGRLVERLYGNVGFAVLYLASGLLSSVLSHLINVNLVCAGASGAVFGVYGALLAYLLRCRGSVPSKVLHGLSKSGIFFVGYNLFYGAMHAGIDNAAHVGGLAAGFLCGMVMAQRLTPEALGGRRVRGALVAAATALLLVAGASAMKARKSSIAALRPLMPAAAREMNQALDCLKYNQGDQAIAHLNNAIEIEPKYALLRVVRGDVYLDKGDWDRALADFDEGIRLDPHLAVGYSDRAGAYVGKEDWTRAIADCDEALRLDPKLAIAHANRAAALVESGQPDKAIVDCDAALRLDGDLAIAYANRGRAHLLKGDYARAVADCESAIQLDPNTMIAYLNRGIAYVRQGSLKRGIADLRLVVEHAPASWLAHQHLAWVLATCREDALRDPKRAMDHAKRACELTNWQRPACLDAFAAASAATGAFAEAVKWQSQAIQSPAYPPKDLPAARRRLALYQAGKPWREEGP